MLLTENKKSFPEEIDPAIPEEHVKELDPGVSVGSMEIEVSIEESKKCFALFRYLEPIPKGPLPQ